MSSTRTEPNALHRLVARARRWLAGRDEGWWQSAGGLVFNARREVALIRQGRRWGFPKGRRDPGEALEGTASREVLEETGLRARILERLGRVDGQRHETHWYLMALVSDGGAHDDEVDEVSFVSAREARRRLRSPAELGLLDRALDRLDEHRVGWPRA